MDTWSWRSISKFSFVTSFSLFFACLTYFPLDIINYYNFSTAGSPNYKLATQIRKIKLT
jgi:hypothetical protein